jgi:hypothetical protein
METIMVVGEFFVVEFDVGSGIFKEKVWFWRKADGHRHGLERHMHGSSQYRTMLLLGVVEEDLPLIMHLQRV